VYDDLPATESSLRMTLSAVSYDEVIDRIGLPARVTVKPVVRSRRSSERLSTRPPGRVVVVVPRWS